MFTPQQIDQVSFGRSTFGGYDMQQVDEFLEPLTEDYVTLYKENALLKSKMRVLVGKLEEYRKNEASMKDAVIGELQEQLRTCIQALDRIKAANAPAPEAVEAPAPVQDKDVADEIAQNIETMIGSTVDTAPKAAPKHPTNNDTTTSKFASLNLQFGRNYDPTSK